MCCQALESCSGTEFLIEYFFFGTKFNKVLPNSDIRMSLFELRTKKLIILFGILLQNNFIKLHSIMRLLLLGNDEVIVFFNPLTVDNVTYRRVDEIRKNMNHFLHIQNVFILLNPLKVKSIR